MSDDKLQQLNGVSYELRQLHSKANLHIAERTKAESYVYADTYKGWVDEYNRIVNKYNSFTSANLLMKSIEEYELSSTKKTARTDAAESFTAAVFKLADKVDADIAMLQQKTDPTLPNQMRICFKTGAIRCPLNPIEQTNKVFVAMPFDDDYKDSYEFGIKIALQHAGIEHYKANNEISNKDIMCKICNEIQICGKIIANISGLNPNVMLELGLAYGLGKDVIVIDPVSILVQHL